MEVMIDRAHLEAKRGEHTHYVVPTTGEKRCCLCLGVWHCEQAEILDLALAAEGYRKALEEERRKFQQETLRTSEQAILLRRTEALHSPNHAPGPWARHCQECALVGDIRELLARPINQPSRAALEEPR